MKKPYLFITDEASSYSPDVLKSIKVYKKKDPKITLLQTKTRENNFTLTVGYLHPSAAEVKFTIPGRPLSINKLYVNIPGQARRFISSEGKAFKKTVGLIAQIAMNEYHFNRILKEESRDVFVSIEYYFETLAGDIDNCNKAILDAMTGIVYEDDSQIATLHCKKHKDKEKPRTVVTIRRANDDSIGY